METAAPVTTNRFDVARNAKTTDYEVHVHGCRHTMARHMEVTWTAEAESGQALADRFEAENDDCFAALGPCAR